MAGHHILRTGRATSLDQRRDALGSARHHAGGEARCRAVRRALIAYLYWWSKRRVQLQRSARVAKRIDRGMFVDLQAPAFPRYGPSRSECWIRAPMGDAASKARPKPETRLAEPSVLKRSAAIETSQP